MIEGFAMASALETILHPKLSKYLGYGLHRSSLMLKTMMEEAIADRQIVIQQFGILNVLEEGGPISQIRLSEGMCVDQASMVRFIDGLEQRKYVVREADKSDRRVKILRITENGREALKEMRKEARRVEAEFLKPLEASERDQLKALLAKLLQAYSTK